jgi:hypothetical protein
MKNSLRLLLFTTAILITSVSFAQDDPGISVKFCGKEQLPGKEDVEYTAEELKSCDLVLTPSGNDMKIISFRLTMITKDDVQVEEDIEGTVIPEKFRPALLTDTKVAYLEFILAVDSKGRQFKLNSVPVRIKGDN